MKVSDNSIPADISYIIFPKILIGKNKSKNNSFSFIVNYSQGFYSFKMIFNVVRF